MQYCQNLLFLRHPDIQSDACPPPANELMAFMKYYLVILGTAVMLCLVLGVLCLREPRGELYMNHLISETELSSPISPIIGISITTYYEGRVFSIVQSRSESTCHEFQRVLKDRAVSFSDDGSESTGCELRIDFADGVTWASNEVLLAESQICFWLRSARPGDQYPTHKILYSDIHDKEFSNLIRRLRTETLAVKRRHAMGGTD
jgi:hypothetical protein